MPDPTADGLQRFRSKELMVSAKQLDQALVEDGIEIARARDYQVVAIGETFYFEPQLFEWLFIPWRSRQGQTKTAICKTCGAEFEYVTGHGHPFEKCEPCRRIPRDQSRLGRPERSTPKKPKTAPEAPSTAVSTDQPRPPLIDVTPKPPAPRKKAAAPAEAFDSNWIERMKREAFKPTPERAAGGPEVLEERIEWRCNLCKVDFEATSGVVSVPDCPECLRDFVQPIKIQKVRGDGSPGMPYGQVVTRKLFPEPGWTSITLPPPETAYLGGDNSGSIMGATGSRRRGRRR